MIEIHKQQVEWWKAKLGLSDYGVAWIAFFKGIIFGLLTYHFFCLLYTSPSPRDRQKSRMPSSA